MNRLLFAMILLLPLFVTGCAERKTYFTPVSIGEVRTDIQSTRAAIQNAQKDADRIAQQGTKAGSPEAVSLQVSLSEAQQHAQASDAALAAHDTAAAKQMEQINATLQSNAKAIASANVRRTHWLYFSIGGFVLAAVLAIIGPWLAVATGYGLLLSKIPILGSVLTGAERVVAVLLGLILFVGLSALGRLFGLL